MISRVAVALCCRAPLSIFPTKRCPPAIRNHPGTLLRPKTWQLPRRYFMDRRKEEKKPSIWNQLFGKYLLTTNTISSGLLMVLGDWVAQLIEIRRLQKENKDASLDYHRIWRMFIVGALMGPMHHYVYRYMDIYMPATTVRNTSIKILIDQLVMSPMCILLFFYSACFLENKSVDETNDEVKSKFLYIYITDWLVWPGAQYINFQYLDTKYRVIFVNVCTAVYNIFLSYMKHEFDQDTEIL